MIEKRLLLLVFIGFQSMAGDLFSQVTKALFLGNSYTASFNLPDMVAQLANAAGDSLYYQANTPGGYTLSLHSQNATSLSLINQENWDYVILQAQSQEPSIDTPYVVANVFPYARMLDSLIHLNDSCTQTVFFMTWGRKYGDASNCGSYPPVCTYDGMQGQLRGRYLQMAYDNGAVVAPCGVAWRNTIATNPSFDLFSGDFSHPSLHGTYLNACVFYTTIYKRSPVGLNYYGGLPAQDALYLQTLAASTVFDSLDVWNTMVYYPDASFTATNSSGYSYMFQSNEPGSHEWDFGSGLVSGGNSENYTFSGPGQWPVTHVVSNGCLTDTLVDTLILLPAGVIDNQSVDMFVVYDPASGLVVHSGSNGTYDLKIYSIRGDLIYHDPYGRDDKKNPVVLNNAGIYFVMISEGNDLKMKKFLHCTVN